MKTKGVFLPQSVALLLWFSWLLEEVAAACRVFYVHAGVMSPPCGSLCKTSHSHQCQRSDFYAFIAAYFIHLFQTLVLFTVKA